MRVVPGLLQTKDYARAVISAGKPRDTSAAIDRAVSARPERQAIQRENPPMLRHVVGSPAIMREQQPGTSSPNNSRRPSAPPGRAFALREACTSTRSAPTARQPARRRRSSTTAYALTTNDGIHATSPVAASRCFAALAIQAFPASPPNAAASGF
jgi:hypothetical protein